MEPAGFPGSRLRYSLMRRSAKSGGPSPPKSKSPATAGCALISQWYRSSASSATTASSRIKALLRRFATPGPDAAASENERKAMWRIRDSVDQFFRYGPAFLYDVSLAIRDMDAYVKDVKQRLTAAYPDHHCFTLGHIGDGNIHFAIAVGSGAAADHKRVNACVYEPLQPIGGSVSAEHGIGTEKLDYLPLSRSQTEIDLMRRLKAALDPKGILNPGKVFPLA